MAHRALALRYRPQVFGDLVGQEHVSQVLTRAIETGRVAHAYLFTGARGVGKTTTARILAKALNCERRASGKQKGADPCNVCTSCTEVTSGVSLDVAEIDGASNRGIADVQALREKVRFAPTGGRWRVVIIDEVHQLSNDAFAALLKTLEEPPPHLVFIFATTDPQKLPDTIRSRCQRFDFARVPLRKIADRLLDIAAREAKDQQDGVKFTITEGAALLIAHQSEGALRDAVSALDQVISSGEPEVDEERVRTVLGLPDREAFFTLADAILARDPKSTLHALHRAFEKGLDARDLAEGLTQHIRHLLVVKVDPQGGDLVPATSEELKRLRAQAEGWSETDLLRLLRNVSEVLVPMKESPQPLVHLEAAVLQMATLEPGDTLAEILARLEDLERRLSGGPSPSTPSGGSRPASGGPRSVSTAPVSASAAPPPMRATASMGTAPEPARATAPTPVPAAPVAARPVATPVRGPAAYVGATAVATATLADAAIERDDRADGCWRDLVAGINGRKRMLGAFLEESRFVGCTPDTLVIAMDDMHRAVVEDKENRSIIAEELHRAFGRALDVRCVAADAPGAPPKPSAEDVKAMTERAIAWFHGEAVTPANRRPERMNG
jgi:DNA polymerase-3 subunit gamma/tau